MKPTRKKAKRKGVKRKIASSMRRRLDAPALFPRLPRGRKAFGSGVLIAVAECQGRQTSLRIIRREAFSVRAGDRNRTRLLAGVDENNLARMLSGIGQRHRVVVLRAILAGANTHAALKKVTGLAAGPLYHHLRSLERAALVTFVERNRYDVSRVGRDLIMLATAICPVRAGNGRVPTAKSNVP